MATIAAFSPEILLNPTSTTRFLDGQKETAEILHSSPPHGRTWEAWGSMDELYFLVSGFTLTVASYLLHAICLRDLSKRCWVMSRHAMADASVIKAQQVFENNLLTRSINIHRTDTADFYLQSSLRSPYVTYPDSTNLNFFHKDGVCRGMCHWFVFLYFKTQAHFTNPEQHIRAVGQQFEQGAASQPAFLHSLTLPAMYDLLKLNVHPDDSKISVAGKTSEQIIHEFQRRVPGVYGIYTSTHQLIYIKIDDNQQYLFDPNVGCVKITSTELFKNSMAGYLDRHDGSREILIDRYTSR